MENFYGDVDKIAVLCNLDATDVTEEIQETINAYIDAEVNIYGFNQNTRTEKQNVKRTDLETIILERSPVIGVEYVKHFVNTDNPVTLGSNDYDVDLDTGIIQLRNSRERTIEDRIVGAPMFFSAGVNAIEVKYTHGYETVPDDVRRFANTFGARLVRELTRVNSDERDGNLKSVKIGDFSESYDVTKAIEGMAYDTVLQAQLRALKMKYFIAV